MSSPPSLTFVELKQTCLTLAKTILYKIGIIITLLREIQS